MWAERMELYHRRRTPLSTPTANVRSVPLTVGVICCTFPFFVTFFIFCLRSFLIIHIFFIGLCLCRFLIVLCLCLFYCLAVAVHSPIVIFRFVGRHSGVLLPLCFTCRGGIAALFARKTALFNRFFALFCYRHLQNFKKTRFFV